MQTTVSPYSMSDKNSPSTSHPWFMLIARSVLFILFQVLIALFLSAMGIGNEWDESARWWTFAVIFTNLTTIFLLIRVYRAEGKRYLDSIRFSRSTWKNDLLWFIGFSIIGIPIADFLRVPLANTIFGDVTITTQLMFRPLPTWAFVLSFLFPLTIAFAELPTYFGYVMPRLEAQLKNGWLAWIIASFFLAAQHMFFPFIFNSGFLLWRLGMFIPFAFYTGLVLKFRPTLLPYFLITHTLLDITVVLVYLMV